MKPKSNFVVEIKKSRRLEGTQKRRSLWADVNLDEAKRHEAPTSGAVPAYAAQTTDHGEAAVPAPGPQPRILPTIVEPATSEVQTRPAEKDEPPPVEVADDSNQADPDVEKRPRCRRQPRLRQWRQTALPPGQRWKKKLPRVLQKPE